MLREERESNDYLVKTKIRQGKVGVKKKKKSKKTKKGNDDIKMIVQTHEEIRRELEDEREQKL